MQEELLLGKTSFTYSLNVGTWQDWRMRMKMFAKQESLFEVELHLI
jgi:hypothetical protein